MEEGEILGLRLGLGLELRGWVLDREREGEG